MVPMCTVLLYLLPLLVRRDYAHARNFTGPALGQSVSVPHYITLDLDNLEENSVYEVVGWPYSHGFQVYIEPREPYRFDGVMHGDTKVYITDIKEGDVIDSVLVTAVDETMLVVLRIGATTLKFAVIGQSAVMLTPREYRYMSSHIATPETVDINQKEDSEEIETSVTILGNLTYVLYRAIMGHKIDKIVDNEVVIWEAENTGEHCWLIDAVFIGEERIIKVAVEGENYDKVLYYTGRNRVYHKVPSSIYHEALALLDHINLDLSVNIDDSRYDDDDGEA